MSKTRPIMISGDGGVVAQIGPGDMTWFSFLQISRAINSTQGGWNSKTHWVDSGLKRLVADSAAALFITKWTRQSLKTETNPPPRTKDFRLKDRQKKLEEKKRGAAERPAPKSENEINFELSLSTYEHLKSARLQNQRVVAFELPLSSESKGQLKADVVVFDQSGMIEIIELKKSGATGSPDNPLMALTEAVCYAIQILRCWSHLRKDLNKFPGEPWPERQGIRTISIVLAAPPDYWTSCKPDENGSSRRTILREEAEALRAIVSGVQEEVRKEGDLNGLSLALTLAEVRGEETTRLSALSIEDFQNTPPEKSIVVD